MLRARPCAPRSPTSSHFLTCTLRPTIAGAPRQASPCARSPMPIEPLRARMRVELTVNGETRTVEVEPRMSLLDCLRERLLLTGAHAGCEHGVCGACTVLIDGAPARSCLMFAVQADGYAITTIEGVAPGPGELSPIQDAFCETHGMQCGYCTPAMILTAHALLADHPAARILAIDKAEALAMPGVHYVLDGRELAAATQPLLAGLDTPKVPRRPLAVDVARYAGEWVAAVVAETRALAEDAAELV